MIKPKNTAHLSPCRQYRYALWRTWDTRLARVMFIGLNPSTADETQDDPTLRRCMNFARQWGYGGLVMANLFAFRATAPDAMKQAADPIGPQNNRWLKKLANESDLVIAAWGNHGDFMGRATAVRKRFSVLHCLKINSTGTPGHPLYQRADLSPVPYPSNAGR
ncbi:DUF1643 domain-containing protein [Simiduia sp. 21SJ11W-1]|uniref:DUF1643 domain-containing protein n=1 Tax=Simiduia sp. 21SJ11W-1 TaxID=2909669 RepID=UPI00209FD642|nr:DUF1643 domain-containing protein [Simiduia sp. 21SJ11W-1]UTA47198.1 DUF1643 domain-containing protein [Simiduia sp. 21SJ11W-1]